MPTDPVPSDRDTITQIETKLGHGLMSRCGDTTGHPYDDQHRCTRFAGHEHFWLVSDHRADDGTTW